MQLHTRSAIRMQNDGRQLDFPKSCRLKRVSEDLIVFSKGDFAGREREAAGVCPNASNVGEVL